MNQEQQAAAEPPGEMELVLFLPGLVERTKIMARDTQTVDAMLMKVSNSLGDSFSLAGAPGTGILRVIGRHICGWHIQPLPPAAPDKAAAIYEAQVELLKSQRRFFDQASREQGRGEEWRGEA